MKNLLQAVYTRIQFSKYVEKGANKLQVTILLQHSYLFLYNKYIRKNKNLKYLE